MNYSFRVSPQLHAWYRMDEWCTKQHGQVCKLYRDISSPEPFQSGLTQACLDSPHSHEDVTKAVAEYIKKWIPQRRVGILAGNSVHADRAFLVKHMPRSSTFTLRKAVLNYSIA
jgi:oligoribonuclease